MIEVLVKESYELPAFSTLDRLGYEARAAATSLYISRIFDSLSKESIELSGSILKDTDESGNTLWHRLKEEPKRPSINGFARFYKHSKWVRGLAEAVGALPELPEAEPAGTEIALNPAIGQKKCPPFQESRLAAVICWRSTILRWAS